MWVDVCQLDKDCNNEMLCRDYFYDLDNALTSWDRGKICVGEWILPNCETEEVDENGDPVGRSEFMLVNNNYNITNFDYTYSQRCIEMQESGAHAIAATVMSALAAMFLLN